MPPGSYRATTCRGEGIKLWITDMLFWPHNDMEGLPGWVISPMPGPPPRQHKHERQYTPSIHPFIPTRWIWKDDYGGQTIFGDLVVLKFPTFVLQVKKNPEKTSPRKPVPTEDRTRARCVISAHATTCSTAVDLSQKFGKVIHKRDDWLDEVNYSNICRPIFEVSGRVNISGHWRP